MNKSIENYKSYFFQDGKVYNRITKKEVENINGVLRMYNNDGFFNPIKLTDLIMIE